MADNKTSSLSGLTEQEAKEFHVDFMTSFIALHRRSQSLLTSCVDVAPWLPGPAATRCARRCTGDEARRSLT